MRLERLLLSLVLTGGLVLTACATSQQYVQRTYRTEKKTAAEVDADIKDCWSPRGATVERVGTAPQPSGGDAKRDAYRQCMEEKGYRIDFQAGNKFQEEEEE